MLIMGRFSLDEALLPSFEVLSRSDTSKLWTFDFEADRVISEVVISSVSSSSFSSWRSWPSVINYCYCGWCCIGAGGFPIV